MVGRDWEGEAGGAPPLPLVGGIEAAVGAAGRAPGRPFPPRIAALPEGASSG